MPADSLSIATTWRQILEQRMRSGLRVGVACSRQRTAASVYALYKEVKLTAKERAKYILVP